MNSELGPGAGLPVSPRDDLAQDAQELSAISSADWKRSSGSGAVALSSTR